MSGAEVMAGIGIIGTFTQVVGQVSAAQSSAEAARKEAEMKRFQANELLARNSINAQILSEKARETESQVLSMTGGGFGSTLGDALRVRKNLNLMLIQNRREAEYKATMLRQGADIQTGLASDMQTAGYLSAGGSLLTGTARFLDAERKYMPKGNEAEVEMRGW